MPIETTATITERHSGVGAAARLDAAYIGAWVGGSRQIDLSVRHDADMTAIARKVLTALDDWVRWETATGADNLRKLMPEFRRLVNLGVLDPTRCPECDDQLERGEDANENGVHVFFYCASSMHTFRAEAGTNGEVPDFSEFESQS